MLINNNYHTRNKFIKNCFEIGEIDEIDEFNEIDDIDEIDKIDEIVIK